MSRFLLLAVALVVLGCSPSALNPPKTSRIERVPIPQTAVEEPLTPYPSPLAVLNDPQRAQRTAVYRVPDASFEQLWRWYEQQLPRGRDWQGWTWCDQDDPTRTPGGGIKVYHRPTQRLSLLVMVIQEDTPGRANGVLIGVRENEPCIPKR